MNAEETKQAAAVMIAWAEGKKIEARPLIGGGGSWLPAQCPNWDWSKAEYRLSPEPIEVEVWVHDDGSIRQGAWYKHSTPTKGWTLRRATIHPETK